MQELQGFGWCFIPSPGTGHEEHRAPCAIQRQRSFMPPLTAGRVLTLPVPPRVKAVHDLKTGWSQPSRNRWKAGKEVK